MEFITTYEEVIEFVNQFVDIEELIYNVPRTGKGAAALGFIKAGSLWSSDGKDYEWDGALPESVTVYNPELRACRYLVNGIMVTTARTGADNKTEFNAHGVEVSLDHFVADDGRPHFPGISIVETASNVRINIQHGNRIVYVESPFTDIDGEILTRKVAFHHGELYTTEYTNCNGHTHCRAGPAYICKYYSTYSLANKSYSKAKWTKLRNEKVLEVSDTECDSESESSDCSGSGSEYDSDPLGSGSEYDSE
jgi:hypothetical protein